MKYMLIGRPRATAQMRPTSDQVRQAKDWVNARIADGTFDCLYGLASGGGVTLINAESHDKVRELLTEYPLYFYAEWEVHALTDGNFYYDTMIRLLKKMEGKQS